MSLRLSSRLPGQLAANALAAARERYAGRFVDLTATNPTLCGFTYPADVLQQLSDPRALHYLPAPAGLVSAREAICRLYEQEGVRLAPEQVLLTASTSEAYTFLFKLLCDPGEAVLVPTPSYPLFEHLARLEGVQALPYHLVEEEGWGIDLGEMAAAPASVRAAVVVHPNNPTGSPVSEGDAAALAELCWHRGWALIADEVFLPFPLEVSAPLVSFSRREAPLTFVLNGLSKLAGLPQLKLAWVVTLGPAAEREAALTGLEFIADTFLSVATPVQLALPRLLAAAPWVRRQILSRCYANLHELRRCLAPLPAVTVPPVGGGWSAVVRVPNLGSDEQLVLHLLERFGVAVYPGYFFDFRRDGYLVVSLLPQAELFAAGAARLAAGLAAWLAQP